MTNKIELLPLPRPSFDYPYAYDGDDMENYALANVAHTTAQLQAEVEALREVLALLPDEIAMIEHNPDEGPLMFCCGRKVTLSRHHGLIPIHDEGCWYMRMRVLRDHYQKDRND